MSRGAMAWLLLSLCAVGCGGSAIDIPDVQDVEQQLAPKRAMNWCCDGGRDGMPVLDCGFSIRPDDTTTCYCSGIVSADTEECRDTEPFTPGTLCTSDDQVCW